MMDIYQPSFINVRPQGSRVAGCSVEVASDLTATGTTAGNARAAAVRWPRGARGEIGGSR